MKTDNRNNLLAFTMIEVLVAVFIAGIGLAAIYGLSSQCFRLSISAYRANQANTMLQEQLERIKGANYNVLLSSGSLSSFMSANPLASAASLTGVAGLTDTVLVSGLMASGSAVANSPSLSVRASISNSGSQSVSVVSSGSLASSISTVKVQVTLNWLDRAGTHSSSQTTLVSSYD